MLALGTFGIIATLIQTSAGENSISFEHYISKFVFKTSDHIELSQYVQINS